MTSLEEAWAWYDGTRRSLTLIRRIADRYWERLPWEGPMGGDDRLRDLSAPTIVEQVDGALSHLEDLSVLVLFSVFESLVRERVLSSVRSERERIVHPHTLHILDSALDGIEHGSFYRILEVFKLDDHNVVEQVKQVRRYRNWVAHGRRSDQPAKVDPRTAYDRLGRFLEALAAGQSGAA